MPKVARTEVWQIVRLPMTPEVLDGIEFRRISRQELKFESAVLARHEVACQPPAMRAQTPIPKKEDWIARGSVIWAKSKWSHIAVKDVGI